MSLRDSPTQRDLPDNLTAIDERILEILAIEGNMTPLALSADDIPPRLPYGEATVEERCNVLHHLGYLEHCNGVYHLSDRGRAALCRY